MSHSHIFLMIRGGCTALSQKSATASSVSNIRTSLHSKLHMYYSCLQGREPQVLSLHSSVTVNNFLLLWQVLVLFQQDIYMNREHKYGNFMISSKRCSFSLETGSKTLRCKLEKQKEKPSCIIMKS